MREFQAGDNAVITKAFHEENIGRTVRLVECSTAQVVFFKSENGTLHSADNPDRLKMWTVEGELKITDYFDLVYTTNRGVIPEIWLTRLDGYQPTSEDIIDTILDAPAPVIIQRVLERA